MTTTPTPTPPRVISRLERDLRRSIIARENIAPALYCALQAESYGVIDDIPWAAVSPAVRRNIERQAELAVAALSSTTRAMAEARAREALDDLIGDTEKLVIDDEPIDQYKLLRRGTLAKFDRALQAVRPATIVLDVYQHALLAPETPRRVKPTPRIDVLQVLIQLALDVSGFQEQFGVAGDEFAELLGALDEGLHGLTSKRPLPYTDANESVTVCLLCRDVDGHLPSCVVDKLARLVEGGVA